MYLGLDLGASAVKAFVIDEAGAVVGSARAALTTAHPCPDASEQDCEAWWHGVCAVCRTKRGRRCAP